MTLNDLDQLGRGLRLGVRQRDHVPLCEPVGEAAVQQRHAECPPEPDARERTPVAVRVCCCFVSKRVHLAFLRTRCCVEKQPGFKRDRRATGRLEQNQQFSEAVL